MPDDLVAFLRARLAVDEQVAREATAGQWRNAPTSRHYEDGAGPSEAVFTALPDTGAIVVARTGARGDRNGMVNAEHIARHDPARVLAEVDTKRRIVDGLAEALDRHADYITGTFTVEDVLRLLALPYADHPDYQPEWAPEG